MITKSMNKMMKKVFSASIALAAVAVTMTSCEFHEQLCEKDHPHKSQVQFHYDWSKLPPCYLVEALNPKTDKVEKIHLPNKTFILGDRLLAQEMQSFGFYPKAPEMEDGAGYYLSKMPEGMTDEENNNIVDFDIVAGEYKFLTTGLNNADFEYSIEPTDMGTHEMGDHFGNLWLSNKTFDVKSMEIDRPFESFDKQYDLNNYISEDGVEAQYIKRLTTPVIVDSTGVIDCYESDVHKVTFTPTTVTENVDLYFDLKKEILDNFAFRVDSVWCILSGIPRRINLGTGQLDISHTDKLMFPTYFVATDKVPAFDSERMRWETANLINPDGDPKNPANHKKTLRCHANLTINGIVPNEDANKYAGTGVMQMIIFAHVYQYNTEDKTWNWVEQKITGRVNLFNALKNNAVMKLDDETLTYRKTSDHVNLYLKLDAVITKKLLTGQSDEPFIGNWKVIEVDDEYDF